MVVQLGQRSQSKPAVQLPAPKPTSTEVKPPVGALKPGFRTTAPRNILQPVADNPTPSPAKIRPQVSNIARAAKEVQGAVTILQQAAKKASAAGGVVDPVALSNALNQLQRTSSDLEAIVKAIS